MSKSKLMKLIDGKNIALIYFLSVVAYLLYYFVLYNQDLLRESILVFIIGAVFLIAELLLLILPAASAIVGIKQKTLQPFPAVLTIIAVALTLLYILLLTANVYSFNVVQDIPKMLFFMATPLSLLYGFAAFAVKIDTPKIKAAQVCGTAHALFGVAMTFFYYKIYSAVHLPETLIVGFGIWVLFGLVAGVLLMLDRKKSEPKPTGKKGVLQALGIGAVIVLILVTGSAFFVTGGGDTEWIDFWEHETVPEDAIIIHLTEEDYEKYPMLKDIPKTLTIDKSAFAPILSVAGLVDKETGYEIIETYGHYVYSEGSRPKERFIEHEGTLYAVGHLVS